MDSVEENRAFAEKFSLPFPLLCDTQGQASTAYGAIASTADQYPARYTYVIGVDGLIEQAIDTQDPANQAADLLAGF
jgi:thioredoxin-dependent peroxiredoxin